MTCIDLSPCLWAGPELSPTRQSPQVTIRSHSAFHFLSPVSPERILPNLTDSSLKGVVPSEQGDLSWNHLLLSCSACSVSGCRVGLARAIALILRRVEVAVSGCSPLISPLLGGSLFSLCRGCYLGARGSCSLAAHSPFKLAS